MTIIMMLLILMIDTNDSDTNMNMNKINNNVNNTVIEGKYDHLHNISIIKIYTLCI